MSASALDLINLDPSGDPRFIHEFDSSVKIKMFDKAEIFRKYVSDKTNFDDEPVLKSCCLTPSNDACLRLLLSLVP